MLDMGFKPAVDRIVKQMPRERQTMFFSATLEGEVGKVGQDLHARRPPARARRRPHETRPTSAPLRPRRATRARSDALVARAQR